jgi:uncharacterized membrane protein
VNGARTVIVLISAAAGVCFAALTALSIRAALFPARRFHVFSIVIAVVAICFACLALRAAFTAGGADEDSMLLSLRHGMFGAFAGLILSVLSLVLFGDTTRSFVAHALNRPTSTLTTFLLLVASVLLGFAAGFVVRKPANSRLSSTA